MPWINRDLEAQKKQKIRQEKQRQPEEPDEVEATVEYVRRQALNQAASVFDHAAAQEGINTRKSVFDQKAIFMQKEDSE